MLSSRTSQLFGTQKSQELYEQICQYTPGGVNSPFRTFDEVGGHPIFFNRAEGAYLYDIDGNRYLDFLGAWGPALLGHSHPHVVSAVEVAIKNGLVFGTPHEFELEFARLVVDAVESLEMVRFVSSGTEAVMSAVRLARGFSGKDKIVAFEGGYHGHFDSVLSSQSHQSSTGIPQALAQNTILLPFGDLSAVEVLLKEKNKEIACVLVEPVPGSMTVIETEPAYLQGLRTLCTKYGVLLVFDEVITGFRLARGGAQEYFKVNADLTCYGKALAGGMPVGAYGGSKEIMRSLMPEGKVYQAGTFSGNPLTMAAGIAVLRELENPQNYKKLESLGQLFFDLLNKQIKTNSWPVQLQRVGSMFSIVFSAKPVHSFADTQMIDAACYARFFHYCLDSGLYMPPSAVDAACFSMAHQQADMETAASIMLLALKKCFETKT